MKKLFLSIILLLSVSLVVQAEERDFRCGVIFGAAVWRDDQPSHALYDRIKTGTDLYNSNIVNCLVLSGGPSTYGAHEASVMKDFAIGEGVPKEDLFIDYEGLNTEATIRNLPQKIDHYVFISNDFHLGRIRLLAKRLDVGSFETYAATYHRGRYGRDDWFRFREFGGSLYTFFFVW